MSATRPRLTAEERRQSVLRAAARVFSKSSYRGATTAEIARESGVTEPVLYRHFASKRDLYLACLDTAWEHVRRLWEEAVAAEADPALKLGAMGRAYIQQQRASDRIMLSDLWIQALTEASEDPKIRRYLRDQVREVHAFVAGVIRRSQQAGGIVRERDPDAEAWIFIGGGLLFSISSRLGGLLTDEDLARISEARMRWLAGQ